MMSTLSIPIRRTSRLSPTVSFGLLTSILVMLLASSSAPTPLYATYQAQWGFSAITITVIFGVYAVAVLLSLLVFGALSDHVGRRPVLLAALVIQAGVMLVFAFAGGVEVLLVARVLQGLATGAALGAIGAGLVDLHPGRGPVADSACLLCAARSVPDPGGRRRDDRRDLGSQARGAPVAAPDDRGARTGAWHVGDRRPVAGRGVGAGGLLRLAPP